MKLEISPKTYNKAWQGRYLLVFPIETISKPFLRKGIAKLTPCPIEFLTGLTEVVEVRVIPRTGCYIVEIFYEQESLKPSTDKAIAGGDIGLVNLITLSSNQIGTKPLLIIW